MSITVIVIEVGCCHYLHYYVVWLVVGVLDDGVVPSIAKFVVGLFLIVVMNRIRWFSFVGKVPLQCIVVSLFVKTFSIVAQGERIRE